MEDLFRIGVITSTHGLKGEVKVFPTTDDAGRFKNLKECIIRSPKGDINVEKNTCKFFKNMVILSFKEFNDIDAVSAYKGCDLYVTRENAVPLKEGEYYIADALGLPVFTEDGESLGVLKDVMKTGANDVFVVDLDRGGEALIPVIPDCVTDMDFDNGRIVVRLMKGLL